MIIAALALLALLSSCAPQEAYSGAQEVECPECPEATCPEPELYEDVWARSGHADRTAESFVHWDEDVPAEIPVTCAKCHSLPGWLDYLGVDGTKAGVVDQAARIGTTVDCYVCHNQATADLSTVTFPSGVRVRNLGAEARCIECHQGRAWGGAVDEAIAAAAVADDTPSERLAFVNTHSISGATAFGAEVQAAYEYAGKSYQGRYMRAELYFGCTDCHEKHSLEIEFDSCRECHTSAREHPFDVRVDSTDFDGDGNIHEGIAHEVEAMAAALYEAIQEYAEEVAGRAIAFDVGSHPYFFVDSDGDGAADAEETVRANQYNAWTPRLLRAAYNLNYVYHDPGAYAHNSDYTLQVLFDSLEDIGGDVSRMSRPR